MSNRFSPDASREDITASIREDGYAIVEGLIGIAGLGFHQLFTNVSPARLIS